MAWLTTRGSPVEKVTTERHVGDAVVVFDETRVVPLWQADIETASPFS